MERCLEEQSGKCIQQNSEKYCRLTDERALTRALSFYPRLDISRKKHAPLWKLIHILGGHYMGTMMLVLAMVLIWSVAIVKIAADVEKNEQRYKAKEARTKNFKRMD